jgi:capsular polysaccharide transport system permease protein
MNAILPRDVVPRDAVGAGLDEAPASAWPGGRRPRRIGRFSLSALLCVALPTLLAVLYYGFVAADQYVAEARFAVRGSEAAATDMLGVLTGIPGNGASAADALVVRDFVRSRDAVEALERRLDLRAAYSREEADWLARLGPADPIEDVVDYWRRMVEVGYETTSGITTLRVQAFRPDDAVAIAGAILEEGEALVNRLSERARRDAVAFAEAELTRAEERLGAARAEVTRFRDQRQALDPARSAEARLGIQAGLEADLAKAEAELSAMRSYMRPDAPAVVSAGNRIAALRRQVEAERAKLAGEQGDPRVLSGLVADYERLAGEQEFAAKAYVSALASLEAARADAARKHRYLATFVMPHMPEDATRPRRLVGILTVFFASLVAWGIGALGVAAVKDHAGWA